MDPDYVWMGSEEDAKAYEKQSGRWIVANVDQQIGWPEKRAIVKFRDVNLILFPEENEQYPAVAIKLDSTLSDTEARKLILQFLSSLAWAESNAIEVAHWSGGGRPYRMGRSKFGSVRRPKFRITYLADPLDESARLALAFYREAISLDHVAYSFLSYYKIINLRYTRGDRQKAWIRRNLNSINNRDAKERLEALKSEHSDVADYLYSSCRCAIAHAGVSPTVDPENFEDNKRLRSDLPLIKNLAELLVEEHYGVKAPSTIWKEHLYELSGFKKVLGTDLIQKIKKNPSDIKKINMVDSISVRLWGESKFGALEELRPVGFRYDKEILILDCASDGKLVLIALGLDFQNEKLLFDPINGIANTDDGSIQAAEFAADVQEFLGKYFANGALEVWDTQNEICLGRCNPFIPVNIDPSKTFESFKNAKLRCLKVAEERKDKSNESK